jgi:hypothetical protein
LRCQIYDNAAPDQMQSNDALIAAAADENELKVYR